MVLMLVLIAMVALLRFIVWVSGLSGRNVHQSPNRRDDLYIP
jgi:hypothetical protein